MSDELVGNIWRRRVAWSRAADKLKNALMYARASALILSALGAVLETVAATLLADEPHLRTLFAALGAVLLAIATYITARLVTVDAIRSWTRARSVSEALKAEIYTYRAGAAPYLGADASNLLLERTNTIQTAASDLESHVASIDNGATQPPPALNHEDYVSKRVEQQITGYYRKNAMRNARKLAALRVAEFILGLVGTILAALAAFLSSQTSASGDSPSGISAWVAVFTTLGAALAAHMAANRYDFLVMSYYGTARRLEDLVSRWRSAADQSTAESWSAFVKACEDAISVENESWLAKWMVKESSAK